MTPALSIRRPAWLGLAATLVLVLGFGLWSTQTRISGAIVAPGLIGVDRDRQVVQHPDGGVVSEILVAEGATVRAGQPLLRLDGAVLRSELVIVEGRLSELDARAARLTAERDGLPEVAFSAGILARAAVLAEVADQVDGQRRLFGVRAESLAGRKRLLARRIDEIAAQSEGLAVEDAALVRQLQLVEAELVARQGLLDKGLAPAAAVFALQREKARLEGQLGALAAERARTGGQITEIEIELSGMETQRREAAAAELREIGPMLLELAERRRALEGRIDRLEIRAPVDGIVLGMQVTTPQSVLRAAEPALYLIPQDRPLVITARIAPIHIDAIAPGQEADLVFPAFSARDTPHLRGTVTQLSADVLADPQTGAAYYAARVQLAAGERARLGDRVLVPGMPVEVFLATGRRTPLAYLLQPFADYFFRAFRES
jgi:HlyD family secretion protein